MPGSAHPYTGHEAIAVGVLGVRDPSEWVVTYYRCHGRALGCSCDATSVLYEVLARRGELCGGKGGPCVWRIGQSDSSVLARSSVRNCPLRLASPWLSSARVSDCRECYDRHGHGMALGGHWSMSAVWRSFTPHQIHWLTRQVVTTSSALRATWCKDAFPSSGAPLPPTRPSGSCTTRPGSGSTRSPATWRAPAPNLSAPRLPRACETSDELFDRLAAKAFPLLGAAAESEIPATPAAARHHHPKEAA